MSNIKKINENLLKEMKETVLQNGYLSKTEVIQFGGKTNIALYWFKKRLEKELLPYDSHNLNTIFIPYNIELRNNTVLLKDFLKLGQWRKQIFTNSSIRVSFICKKCHKESSTKLTGLINRKYFKEKAYCPSCLWKLISQTTEYKENAKQAQLICKNNPESRRKAFETITRLWANPDDRKRIIQRMHEATKVDGYKEKVNKAGKERWKQEDYRKKIIFRIKERWDNEEFRKKMDKIRESKSTEKNDKEFENRYTYTRKKYIMPSGKKILIQGYENYALDYLLEMYKEEDIVVGAKNIRLLIGEIFYIADNRKHRYFPDIYIISENKIVEVKSIWTYERHLTINNLKKDFSLEKNINFEFMIFGKKNTGLTRRFVKELNNAETKIELKKFICFRLEYKINNNEIKE